MKKILLIDDEEVVRDMMGDMLRHLGFHTVSSRNGTDALSTYEEYLKSGNGFDSVFIDVISRDGTTERATMDSLLEIDPEVKIIISNTTIPHPVFIQKDKGKIAMVPKPFTVEHLKSTLENIFQDRDDLISG
jgi:two-component system cell cycle sensor histidine kinase/response regulator CckA